MILNSCPLPRPEFETLLTFAMTVDKALVLTKLCNELPALLEIATALVDLASLCFRLVPRETLPTDATVLLLCWHAGTAVLLCWNVGTVVLLCWVVGTDVLLC